MTMRVLIVLLCLVFLGLGVSSVASVEPVWNYTTGKVNPIRDILITPDGSTIAAADGSLYLLSNQGEVIVRGPSASVVDISQKPVLIATAGEAAICLFEPSGKQRWCTNDFAGGGTQVQITEDGSYIAVGSDWGYRVYYLDNNGTILWSGVTGSPLYDLTIPADGGFVVTVAADERASSYTSKGAQRFNLFATDYKSLPLNALKMPYDGRFFVGVIDNGNGGKVVLTDTSLNVLWENATRGLARNLAISRDGSGVVVGDWNVVKNTQALVYYFAVNRTNRTGEPGWTFPVEGRTSALAITPKGDYIAVGTTANVVYTLDKNGTVLWRYPLPESITSIAISENGTAVAAGSDEGKIYFFVQNVSSVQPTITTTGTVTVPPTPMTTEITSLSPTTTSGESRNESTNREGVNTTSTLPFIGDGVTLILLVSLILGTIVILVVVVYRVKEID